MKAVYSFATVATLLVSQAHAINSEKAKEISQISTNLNCRALNGLKISTIKSDDPKKSMVRTQFGFVQKEFFIYVNPGFFTWTWVTLGDENTQTLGQGYQIFLLGNAPEGKEITLNGSIGKIIGIPGASGWTYPVGFSPISPIQCRVFLKNTL